LHHHPELATAAIWSLLCTYFHVQLPTLKKQAAHTL
jgi:hypothetical protein